MTPIAPLPVPDHNPFRTPDDARAARVVAPDAAAPVTAALDRPSLPSAGILVTHHPPEHADGAARHGGRTEFAAMRSWKDHYR